ncbi:MAG: hypothetical protein IKP47_12065 [Ruminococcus sp.]|nr:hypothetical protein [Ruminococcus sp.]
MQHENGEWIINGASPRSKGLIRSCAELIEYVDKVGFLPLFSNEIKGFSVEEHAEARYWWSGNAERDPWEWREQAARSGRVVYGKVFGGRAGFISLEWLPYFANFRRDGYDFDSLYEEGLAKAREQRIMELYEQRDRYYSYELKTLAGFGKNGLKNFGGILTELQNKLYLVITDFRCRMNKRGEFYGMPVAQYARPEDVWGSEAVTSAYSEEPEASRERILLRIEELYGAADEKVLRQLI